MWLYQYSKLRTSVILGWYSSYGSYAGVATYIIYQASTVPDILVSGTMYRASSYIFVLVCPLQCIPIKKCLIIEVKIDICMYDLPCNHFYRYIFLGFLSAVDNLLFAWAYAYLPASTASLLAASSLIFSTFFGYFIVKNKIYLSTINAIVVITAGVVIIALDSDSDRYQGITDKQYILGFVWDILGSALHGLIFALSELIFIKILGRRSFHVVLEQQVMVSLAAFIFTSIGLLVNDDFTGMKIEARNFKHGEVAYGMEITWSAVTFQLGVLGGTGVLFLASTVLAGVLNAVRVPITSIAAVIWFHDPMSGFKILSLIITVWGFGSYMIGHSSSSRA
jgi:drug/metabolite transporter (DMT)-like permease